MKQKTESKEKKLKIMFQHVTCPLKSRLDKRLKPPSRSELPNK